MIQLRPPADADNYRVQAGRFGDRFYTDPLPADDTWPATTDDDIHPAISTVKKASGQDWSKAMAKRLAKQPSQLVEIGGLDSEFERKQRINLLSDAGLDGAGNRGTVVHAHAEAKLLNRLPIYQLNDETKPYIRTLDAFLAAYNPTLVASEFVAMHRTLNDHNLVRGNEYLGYGGTGDAVIEIDGKLWLVDWKSRAVDSQHKAYPEEGAQVAAYGRAQYWIVGDDTSPNGAKRIAPLELAGGLIVSIKPDSYECFPIDLDEGFSYWTDLHAWWQARRSERRSVGRKWAPRVPVTSELVTGPEGELRSHLETMESDPVEPPIISIGDVLVSGNRERFKAMTEAQKNLARDKFKHAKVNPNRTEFAVRVAAILDAVEERPSIREAQEKRAEQVAEHTPAPEQPVDPLEAEGGEAPEQMVAEARLMFDMTLNDAGRAWTGFRVVEANEADVPFQLSKMRSVKRAHLYLALCRWATWRQQIGALDDDQRDGNVEFAAILFGVDRCEDDAATLGHRLGMLNFEQAERLATEVEAVVESEIQPASEPASEPEKVK